ncbi:myo-inositol-1(or 4)-monophosphatase [Leucobacter exalbidus]|uniref:Inositol-1-monophosphatase n=1 Tax=Leucobacter exalbidus TaxID=662960 RepID=A0A940Q0J2_9MICO|nr:inositol monophosphatase family protein [Leucobacter exalbidus]MBP1327491.1 myo-inositol-1(or 4)-monophosphatase [Leucobacter exalbidus]
MTVQPAYDASPESLALIATTIARTVGARIHELRARGVDVAAAKSSAVDIVTEADREAERIITEALREARPNDGVVGEEGTGIEGTTGITWVVDPIDGTVNYLYNLPMYTVSIAATVADATAYADGRRAIAGAVYNPSSDEMFEAFEGGGARLNGSPITPTGNTDLATSLVATGFGYTVERRTMQGEIAHRLLPQVRDIRRLGSAANDLCMVACGRVDAYYEIGLQPWDYAAGVLIATEAGVTIIGAHDNQAPGEPFMFVGDAGLVHTLRTQVLGA